MQVTAPPWPSTPGNTHPILPLRLTLLSRAHTRAEVSTITWQETLVVWFFVHCEVMPVRHRSRAPGEHEGPRRKGRRHKGRRCWCLQARGLKAKGRRRKGRRCSCLCMCMRDAGINVLGGELLHQSANLLLCPPRKVVTAARTPTAQGGAAGKVQLDSAHRTTGVACRR